MQEPVNNTGPTEPLQPKRACLSRTMLTDHVLPRDTNNYQTIFGGNVMAYVDKVSAMAAMRHARLPVVTASIDSLDFLAPIRAGEAIYLEAIVTWTHRTSMEIYVKVESEDLLTGSRKLTGTSYLTFVALGADGLPAVVPPVLPESAEERWQFETASIRHDQRQQRKRLLSEQHRVLGL